MLVHVPINDLALCTSKLSSAATVTATAPRKPPLPLPTSDCPFKSEGSNLFNVLSLSPVGVEKRRAFLAARSTFDCSSSFLLFPLLLLFVEKRRAFLAANAFFAARSSFFDVSPFFKFSNFFLLSWILARRAASSSSPPPVAAGVVAEAAAVESILGVLSFRTHSLLPKPGVVALAVLPVEEEPKGVVAAELTGLLPLRLFPKPPPLPAPMPPGVPKVDVAVVEDVPKPVAVDEAAKPIVGEAPAAVFAPAGLLDRNPPLLLAPPPNPLAPPLPPPPAAADFPPNGVPVAAVGVLAPKPPPVLLPALLLPNPEVFLVGVAAFMADAELLAVEVVDDDPNTMGPPDDDEDGPLPNPEDGWDCCCGCCCCC
mmetsp:Transcript_11266/g.24760  ORF Transcript_11266/g.24760 Transcript_11266/m.24760 type:complete len:369 (+) Transcript_11266:1228-2334(+)